MITNFNKLNIMNKNQLIHDCEGKELNTGDKVVLVTKDSEFLNQDTQINRGDVLKVIRHLVKIDGYDNNSNSIEMKHLKTGRIISFTGFRILKINPQ